MGVVHFAWCPDTDMVPDTHDPKALTTIALVSVVPFATIARTTEVGSTLSLLVVALCQTLLTSMQKCTNDIWLFRR